MSKKDSTMPFSRDIIDALMDAKNTFFFKSSFLECMVMVTFKLHLYSICRIVKEQGTKIIS